MVSCSKIDLFWMYGRHGYFRRESGVNLPFFRQNRSTFGDFQRGQTTADADNTLKIKVNKTVTTVSDNRRSAQIGYMIRDGIR
jgi:aminopeptidase-like protein